MPSLPRIFGLGASRPYALKVCGHLGLSMDEVREEWRPDTEPWAAALANVRDADCFVVSSHFADASRSACDKTMQTLLFVDALKRSSARRVTVVTPYGSFWRQDRKEGSREPVSTQALAKMYEAVGTDRMLMVDPHNPGALQNAYRIPVDLLEAKNLLADAVHRFSAAADLRRGIVMCDAPTRYTVLSPDAGGVKRAKAFQKALSRRTGQEVGLAHADKTRKGGVAEVSQVIGNVRDTRVVVVDDMISTGGTLKSLYEAIVDAGGDPWAVAATHGPMVGSALGNVSGYRMVLLTDTVDAYADELVFRVPTHGLVAEAVRRIHSGHGSISELLED